MGKMLEDLWDGRTVLLTKGNCLLVKPCVLFVLKAFKRLPSRMKVGQLGSQTLRQRLAAEREN